MKQSMFCLLLLACLQYAGAQTPFAKMVVGLEGSWDAQPFSEGVHPRLMPTVQVDYPVGKFSIGFGLAYKRYHDAIESETYLNRAEPFLVGIKKSYGYVYEKNSLTPDYWSVPLRINYRLPCNCVFLQAAASLDFRTSEASFKSIVYHTERPASESAFKPIGGARNMLYTYEVGVGFKLHANDYFRLVMRPSFVWTQNPDLGAPEAFVKTLRITFGAQYAFVRYGGRF